jgi:hypothetical protein
MRGRVSGRDKKFQPNVTLEFLADFQFLQRGYCPTDRNEVSISRRFFYNDPKKLRW